MRVTFSVACCTACAHSSSEVLDIDARSAHIDPSLNLVVRIEFGDAIVRAAVADCVHPGCCGGESGQLGKARIGGCAQSVEAAEIYGSPNECGCRRGYSTHRRSATTSRK